MYHLSIVSSPDCDPAPACRGDARAYGEGEATAADDEASPACHPGRLSTQVACRPPQCIQFPRAAANAGGSLQAVIRADQAQVKAIVAENPCVTVSAIKACSSRAQSISGLLSRRHVARASHCYQLNHHSNVGAAVRPALVSVAPSSPPLPGASWARTRWPLSGFSVLTLLAEGESAGEDQFLRAAPVCGAGEFLMRKMGWRTGEEGWADREGTVEPIIIDFQDRPQRETPGLRPDRAVHKRRLLQPDFVMVHHSGPDHSQELPVQGDGDSVDYHHSPSAPTRSTPRPWPLWWPCRAWARFLRTDRDSTPGPVFTCGLHRTLVLYLIVVPHVAWFSHCLCYIAQPGPTTTLLIITVYWIVNIVDRYCYGYVCRLIRRVA
ncbi:unnamed protein product [Boreogadus saida]